MGYSCQCYIKRSVENQNTYNYPEAERENNDQKRCENGNHHQCKKGNGQAKDDRPFPDVFIDLELLHLYNNSYEVSEDAYYRTGNQNKYENAGNPFFKVSIFAKEVSCIKEETNKENDT